MKTDQPLDLIEHASKKNLLFSYHEITAGLSLYTRKKQDFSYSPVSGCVTVESQKQACQEPAARQVVTGRGWWRFRRWIGVRNCSGGLGRGRRCDSDEQQPHRSPLGRYFSPGFVPPGKKFLFIKLNRIGESEYRLQ